MAVKKAKEAKEKEVKEKEAIQAEVKTSKYFYAVGKRKTSIARVRIYFEGEMEKGVMVNNRKLENYFPIARLADLVKTPLEAVLKAEKVSVSARVAGGGISSQAEAVRLGISRALVKYNETFKKPLRDLGYLTRDSRIVERKKPGLKKARRAPQWKKR